MNLRCCICRNERFTTSFKRLAISSSHYIMRCPPLRRLLSPNVLNHTIADELYPVRVLAADCSFLQYLGFNHVPSRMFLSTFVAFALMHISSLRCSTPSIRVIVPAIQWGVLYTHVTVRGCRYKFNTRF